MDGCQYPGFERVAGGEDALFELHNRFKNRYLCKYVWKPRNSVPLPAPVAADVLKPVSDKSTRTKYSGNWKNRHVNAG